MPSFIAKFTGVCFDVYCYTIPFYWLKQIRTLIKNLCSANLPNFQAFSISNNVNILQQLSLHIKYQFQIGKLDKVYHKKNDIKRLLIQ